MSEKHLVLVDGSSFLYRAFYADKRGFSTQSGIPTGATLIITRMLEKLLETYKDLPIVVVFDAKGKSFRSDIYPLYKANRPPMPENLIIQIEYVHKIVKALGFPLLSIAKVEADDVLGTLATKAEKEGYKVTICTGDKDLSQLVDDNIELVDTMKNVTYNREAVIEKYGVPPELIIDFLALKGDSSDNIPGLKGVGDKTAVALLNGLGGIYDILKKKNEIKNLKFKGKDKFAEFYEENFATVELAYKLATIKRDVDLPYEIKDFTCPKKDSKALLALYKELEFKKNYEKELEEAKAQGIKIEEGKEKEDLPLVAMLESNPDNFKESVPSNIIDDYQSAKLKFKLIKNKAELDNLVEAIVKQKLFAFDTETTSLRYESMALVGISIALNKDEGFYIPVLHSTLDVDVTLDKATVINSLKGVFADSTIKKIGHNIKFDMLSLSKVNIEVLGLYVDTMVLAHTLDSQEAVSLDYQALTHLNYKTISYEDVVGKKGLFSDVPLDLATNYAAEDAVISFRLYEKLLPKLNQNEKLKEYFFNIEMPLINVLFSMEKTGTYVSEKVLFEQNKVLKEELLKVQEEIYKEAGEVFNIASPKQLAVVLFEKLAIPYPKKVKLNAKGEKSYSTAEEILSLLSDKYEIVNKVLRFRALSKLISTYTEKLPLLIEKETSRLYGSFNQTGTNTGRLSSSDPNLQNIPARTKEGKLIRCAFTAPDGYSIVSCDYSQIELRLIAHFSEDEALVNAFVNGLDIHKATAAEVLGINIDEVSAEQRSHAKATNFGLMYGMGAHGLSQQTKMSFSDAKAYIKSYFERYSKVKSYIDSILSEAKDNGYVTTLLNNQIVIANINSSNVMQQNAAKRAATNAPMQGSAADIIKKAMINIYDYIKSLPKDKVRLTMQVHDELVFEVKDDFVEEFSSKVKDIMENVVTLKVPLSVGIGVAKNWGEAH